MGFLDTIKAQQAELSNAELDGGIPRINFYHGVPAADSPGVFFLKQALTSATPGGPWKAIRKSFGVDKKEDGYAAAELRIAPIAVHEVWQTEDASGALVTHAEYTAGAKYNYRILCFAEGIVDKDGALTPCIVSGSGTNKGGALRAIITAHVRGLIRLAKDATGGNVPMHTFWLPIGTKRDANGEPVYVASRPDDPQSIAVTPPIARYPAGTPAELMESLFVGADLLTQGEHVKNELQRTLLPLTASRLTEGAAVVNALPLRSAGRNVPQPLTEAEMDTAVTVVMAAPAAPVKRAVKLPSQSAGAPDLEW